jgi:hypothetical protein
VISSARLKVPIHHDIYPAEIAQRLLYNGFDLHLVGDVEGECQGFSAGGVNFELQFRDFLCVAGKQDDKIVFAGKLRRYRPPDPPGRAGDNRYFFFHNLKIRTSHAARR